MRHLKHFQMSSYDKISFGDVDKYFRGALVKFTSQRRDVLEQLTIPDPNNLPLVEILKANVALVHLENNPHHSSQVSVVVQLLSTITLGADINPCIPNSKHEVNCPRPS